jgi:hypothetical protein
MVIKSIFIIPAILFSGIISCPKDIPSFGKVDKADLEMKLNVLLMKLQRLLYYLMLLKCIVFEP